MQGPTLQKPFQQLLEPYAFIRHFTPNWFAMTMGTGVLALVIAQLPFKFPAQQLIATALWEFGVLLFLLFSALFIARLVRHPDTIKPMLEHPVQSMFLGAIPMGLAILIKGLLVFGLPRWGEAVIPVAYALWWFDAALALLVAIAVPYLMFTRQNHALEKLTAVWLLPIVAPEVAASTAAALAQHVPAAQGQQIVLTAFVLWGMSLALAFGFIALVLLRLAIHKLPDNAFAATSWLPLGPIATGCLGLLALGEAAPMVFADTAMAEAAHITQQLSLILGLALWGAGLWWLVIALLFTRNYLRREMPFNLGWWGFTFPLGVFTLSTFELLRLTGGMFFSTIGLALATLLTLIWCTVTYRTLKGMWNGKLFQAPCLNT